MLVLKRACTLVVYHNSEEGSDVSYPTQEDCVPISLTSLTKGQDLVSEEYTILAN